MSMTRYLIALCAASLLAACAQDPLTEPEPEPEFGSSVRHMIRAQTFNPLAGKAAQPPAGMDGQRVESAIEGYRGAEPVAIPESDRSKRQVWTETSAEAGGK